MDAIRTVVDEALGRQGIPKSEDQPLLRIPEAGAFLNLGRAASYDAARRGDFPTLRVGRRLFVPTAKFRALLGLDA